MTQHGLRRIFDGELSRCLLRLRAHFLLQIPVEAERRQFGGERGEIVDGEQSSFPVHDGIADARRIDADDGESSRHAFDHRERMNFRDGRGCEDVAHRQIRRKFCVRNSAGEFHAIADS